MPMGITISLFTMTAATHLLLFSIRTFKTTIEVQLLNMLNRQKKAIVSTEYIEEKHCLATYML